MNKRQKTLGAAAFILVLLLILPGLVYRMKWEESSKTYVAAIDVTRLLEFFDEEQLPEVLEDYKAAGVTTALFRELYSGYPENMIRVAKAAGLNIALTPNPTYARDADLERLVTEYDVKYINLKKSRIWSKADSRIKSYSVSGVIERHDLTLVLTESALQLGNETPVGYENYLKVADGKIMRAFETYRRINLEQKEYPLLFFEMYNSALDRNTRFMTIKQLEGGGFTPEENAKRTQDSIRLFCDRMEKDGFVPEGEVDYSRYEPNRRLISAAAGAIGVLMAALMLDLLSKKRIPYLLRAGLGGAACVFAATFVLPESLVLLYPTAFSLFAPSFCVAVCAVFVEKSREKLGFAPLLFAAVGLFLGVMLTCGGIMAALLSGADYALNNLFFRGVKASLMVPMVFTFALIVGAVYEKRTLAQYQQLLRNLILQIRWYHLLLLAAMGLVVGIYLIRSGNVGQISFTELYLRNLLTEIFGARPRTKEFLVGWPCFVLYVWYAKTGHCKLLKYMFAMGSSILFASTMNTFCHVFTLAETMFLRVAYGLLFGAIFASAALAVNVLGYKIIEWILRIAASKKKA